MNSEDKEAWIHPMSYRTFHEQALSTLHLFEKRCRHYPMDSGDGFSVSVQLRRKSCGGKLSRRASIVKYVSEVVVLYPYLRSLRI
jgi:hypothetical protein